MDGIKSTIILSEIIENKEASKRAKSHYLPVYIVDGDICELAFFTDDQINVAIERATKNPEDFVPRYKAWWQFWK